MRNNLKRNGIDLVSYRCPLDQPEKVKSKEVFSHFFTLEKAMRTYLFRSQEERYLMLLQRL